MIISKLHFLASNLSSKIRSSGENILRSSCHEVLIRGARAFTLLEPWLPYPSAPLGERPNHDRSLTSAGRTRGGRGAGHLPRPRSRDSSDWLGPRATTRPRPSAYLTPSGLLRCERLGGRDGRASQREIHDEKGRRGPGGPWLTARGRSRGGDMGLNNRGKPCWVPALGRVITGCASMRKVVLITGASRWDLLRDSGGGGAGVQGSRKYRARWTRHRPTLGAPVVDPALVGTGPRPCPAFPWVPLCARYQACRRREQLSNVFSIKHDSEKQKVERH